MVINILSITILILCIVGCVLIDRKKYGSHSILIIIMLFNTFVISLMESIVLYAKESESLVLYLITIFDSIVVILKDYFIYKFGKNNKEHDLLVRVLTRLELITIIGFIALITYLAL